MTHKKKYGKIIKKGTLLAFLHIILGYFLGILSALIFKIIIEKVI
jgi:hypothetical protein